MSKRNILLVEDREDDILLTLRAFRATGNNNNIIVARDGVEALDLLFGGSSFLTDAEKLPSLILIDLKLPKVDGKEVLREIREKEKTRFLPVVILTSSKEEKDILECYELGANSYIRKPLDYKAFIDLLNQVENYWLYLNETPNEFFDKIL